MNDTTASTSSEHEEAAEPSATAFGMDLGALTKNLTKGVLENAVKKAVREQIAAVVDAAVAEVMTEEVIESLRERAHAHAAATVEDLQAQDEESEPEPGSDEHTDEAEEQAPAPQLAYPSAVDFFRDYLRHVYQRQVNGRGSGFAWSRTWWMSAEALTRIDGIWRAWEAARQNPAGGIAVWFRDYADHHMPILMSQEGPFGKSEDGSDRLTPLPHEDPPETLLEQLRARALGEQ